MNRKTLCRLEVLCGQKRVRTILSSQDIGVIPLLCILTCSGKRAKLGVKRVKELGVKRVKELGGKRAKLGVNQVVKGGIVPQPLSLHRTLHGSCLKQTLHQ